MARPVGLRTEIIVNIALLVGAALLFVSFLLLRLTEREVLDERLQHLHHLLEVLSRSGVLSSSLPPDGVRSYIPADAGLVSICFTDKDLIPLGPLTVVTAGDVGEMRQVRNSGESSVKIRYTPLWSPFAEKEENVVVMTLPVYDRQLVSGILQARFSLADISQRIAAAQRLVLVYLLLYGGVLLLFGIYLLGRTVVEPIRRLMMASARVAAGDLDQRLEVKGGGREIGELSDTFNVMQESLKKSREETQETIRSLEQVNKTLHETQDELLRSERMASVGHLAAGMAHEIGNPLGAIIGYLELLKQDFTAGQPRELLDLTAIEASRIDRLVRDLLDYAAPVTSPPEVFDPLVAFVEARELLRHQGVFDHLRLIDRLPLTLPVVRIQRHRLIQVLVNFLLNARDASLPDTEITLSGGEEVGSVWLSVSDSGTGVSPEHFSNLFDPFFTTKAPGKGLGLGLSVCHRIATDAGGRIEVKSTAGSGAEFILWLKKAGDDEP